MGALTQCSPEQKSQSYGNDEAMTQTDTDAYSVEAGDTLSGICRKYGNVFTISDLKAVNSLDGNTIYVDQVLTIPKTRSQAIEQIAPMPKAIPVSLSSLASLPYTETQKIP